MPSHSFSKKLSNVREAKAIYSALLPETGAAYERRAQTKVALTKNSVTFTIDARDVGAMNASAQSYRALVDYLEKLEQ